MGEDGQRYHASESIVAGVFMFVVGAFLVLAFGALVVGGIRDLRAFPASPRPVTVAEAAALADPAAGAWVRIVDGRIDCRHPPHRTPLGSNVYGFLTDASGGPRLLVAMRGPAPSACDETLGAPWVGVLRASKPGRIVDLDWEGIDWRAWPTPHLTVLWTELGPTDSRLGLCVGPLVGLPAILLLFLGAKGIREGRRRARRPTAPPLAEAAFVMPLSTGASALPIFGGAITLVQLAVFGPLFFLKHLPDWMAIPLGLLAALWFFAVVGSLVDGWKRRASDLLLGREDLAVSSGPLHLTRISYRAVDPARFALRRSDGADWDRAVLILDGEVAAASRDQDEERSLAVVVETVHALAAQAAGERRAARERPPGVVCCDGCGAPVPPRDADRATCGHCGAAVVLPAEVREQMQALRGLAAARAETERLLRRLLRQPSAGQTNLLLAVAVPPLLLGWPLAGVLFDEMYQARHVFSFVHGAALFVAALSFTHGLSWLLRAHVVGRAAVRLVATRFAAVPPEVPGEPCSCRHCGGPLPVDRDDQLLSICAYCRSENVLGTNLVPEARRETAQAEDLGAELAARLAERRRYRLVSLASLVLLAVSAASLLPVWQALRGL
jgi:hypothetical protein